MKFLAEWMQAICQSFSSSELQDADRVKLELYKGKTLIGRMRLLKLEEHGWILLGAKGSKKEQKVEVKDHSASQWDFFGVSAPLSTVSVIGITPFICIKEQRLIKEHLCSQ